MAHRGEYRQWPFLDHEEFELACAFFDQRYIQANLGPTRKVFKISHKRVATTGASYIEIIRLINVPDDVGGLSSVFQKLNSGGVTVSSQEMEVDMIDEEDDHEALREPPPYSPYSHQPYVVYEIHLHQTYQQPALFFTLHDLPMGEQVNDIDSVFRYLVPEDRKDELRGITPLGALSLVPHPVTDYPAWCVHPCQTKEAMESFDCPIRDFLMQWIGIVGGCVGLWVPREMAMVGVNGQ